MSELILSEQDRTIIKNSKGSFLIPCYGGAVFESFFIDVPEIHNGIKEKVSHQGAYLTPHSAWNAVEMSASKASAGPWRRWASSATS